MSSHTVTLALGCTAEPIASQLKKQGFEFKSTDATYWQSLANSIDRLYIRSLLTHSQREQSRKKLLRLIVKGVAPKKARRGK